MKKAGSASNYHMLSIIETCCRQGVDRNTLLKAAELEEESLSNLYDRQPEDKVINLWHTAEKLSNNPLFAFGVGGLSNALQRSSIMTLIESCATIGEAIQYGLRYMHLTQDIVTAHIYIEGEFCHYIVDENGRDLELVRPLIERQIATVAATGYVLATDDISKYPQPVATFKTRPIAEIGEYEKMFMGRSISFEQDENRLSFPKAFLEMKNFAGSKEMFANILPLVQQQDREYQEGGGTSSQLRQLIYNSLGTSTLTVEDAAQELKVSVRTLQRRLKEEETSFSDIYDISRKQRALELLKNSEMSMQEISYFLGFNHMTGFYTAFQRWTGTTPKQHIERTSQHRKQS